MKSDRQDNLPGQPRELRKATQLQSRSIYLHVQSVRDPTDSLQTPGSRDYIWSCGLIVVCCLHSRCFWFWNFKFLEPGIACVHVCLDVTCKITGGTDIRAVIQKTGLWYRKLGCDTEIRAVIQKSGLWYRNPGCDTVGFIHMYVKKGCHHDNAMTKSMCAYWDHNVSNYSYI